MNAPRRVIMDFEQDDMDRIDALKSRMRCVSRTELIRRALGLMAVTEKYTSQDYAIQFIKGDEIKHVEFVGWRL